MEQLKKERTHIRKDGILEVRGYFFNTKMSFRLTGSKNFHSQFLGNVLSQYDQTGKKKKGHYNLKQAEITESNSNKLVELFSSIF